MEYSLDWRCVEITRIKDDQRDCYLFVDRHNTEVVVNCKEYANTRVALKVIKKKVLSYLKYRWVIPTKN